jgi:hypothetical protein
MPAENPSDPKYLLAADVHQWIVRKLVAGEGFSVLLVSNHPTGKKMTTYQRDTVEEALAQCRSELSSSLADATAYALVFDARTKIGNEMQPMLVLQVEQRGVGASTQFAQRYELRRKWLSSSKRYASLEEFRVLGRGESWLHNGA